MLSATFENDQTKEALKSSSLFRAYTNPLTNLLI